jgi:hypothetical protein
MNDLVWPQSTLISAIRSTGFAFVRGSRMRQQLLQEGPLSDWESFVESWDRLQHDTYMADDAKYRRRRHANFRFEAENGIQRGAHRAHFQSPEYNRLHGGIARWFEPVEESIGAGASLQTILCYAGNVFGTLSPQTPSWDVEVHQFRIEASGRRAGRPTPEGMHRDGVDYVLVLLIRRSNIESGTTEIQSLDGQTLGGFTLTHSFDAALVEDARVYHGVTAVTPIDPSQPAFRDVLVATFKHGS